MQVRIDGAINGYIVSAPKSGEEDYDYEDFICNNMDEVVARVKDLLIHGTA